jgi:hypothetical protein
MFVHPNPEAVNRGADVAQCEYEIEMNQRGVYVPRWYNNSQATGYLIGAAIGSAIRNDRLRTLCMQAKGYIAVPLDGGATPIGQPQPYLSAIAAPGPTATATPVAPGQTPDPSERYAGALPIVAAKYAVGAEKPPPPPAKWSYAAEQVAKTNGCVGPATINYSAPGAEAFTVACGREEPISIRCDFGNCRALN